MTKGKWILLSFLMLIPLLLQKLLSNLGWRIGSNASAWLLLAIVTFFVVSIAVPKEYQKYAKWFTIIFLLLFLTSWKDCGKTKSKSQRRNQCQTVKVVQENPAKVKQTSWGYVVEFTGREFEGVKVLAAEKDTQVRIRWIPGGKIHNPEGKNMTNPWGYDDYAQGWKERFRFGWCAGVKPHAVLFLIKKTGESLDSIRQQDIIWLEKPKAEIKFRMNAGEELVLYYHDVNDPWYFGRNGADGSYMRFEIEIF